MQLNEVPWDWVQIWLLLFNTILTHRHTKCIERTHRQVSYLILKMQVLRSLINKQTLLHLLILKSFSFYHAINLQNTQRETFVMLFVKAHMLTPVVNWMGFFNGYQPHKNGQNGPTTQYQSVEKAVIIYSYCWSWIWSQDNGWAIWV